jgi:hypothetical protein
MLNRTVSVALTELSEIVSKLQRIIAELQRASSLERKKARDKPSELDEKKD